MIILDTNVLSELMRPQPSENVTDWLNDQADERITTTSITIAEVQFGILRMPRGKKRQNIETRFVQFLSSGGGLLVLPFDETTASAFAYCACKREKAGLHLDTPDLMIAAIARTADACIATRNTSDFEETGIETVNPWKS